MIWLYGGGYQTGSATLDIYDPSELVRKGEIVVVAVQYRVGSTGFLYMGDNTSASGNVGLYDQVLALEWTKKNIINFGGDPEKITLVGESAGAHGVAVHLTSPLTSELFNRAILQSSGLQARWAVTSKSNALRRSCKFFNFWIFIMFI